MLHPECTSKVSTNNLGFSQIVYPFYLPLLPKKIIILHKWYQMHRYYCFFGLMSNWVTWDRTIEISKIWTAVVGYCWVGIVAAAWQDQ